MAETLLLTGAASPLGRAAAVALERAQYRLRPTDAIDLTDPELAASLVQGVDAVVHLAPLVLIDARPDDPGGELLDVAARGTHVLYRAALAAGVTRAVQASTLGVMDAYPEELEVTEQWRPRPRPEPRHLAPYLAELVAREFARDPQLEVPLTVVLLRLADDVLPADAARALAPAVISLGEGGRARGHRFQLFHVAAPGSIARYSSALAQRTLGYGPAE